MAWLSGADGAVLINVELRPKSSKAEIVGVHGDALKIKVTAPPVDGKANAQLRESLSKWLKVPRSQVTLKAGEAGRRKVLEISGLTVAQVRACLKFDSSP